MGLWDSGDAQSAPNPPAFPTSLRYALASHFFWGLWSILQASMSTIEFGYLVSNPGGQLGGGGGVAEALVLPQGSPGRLWADGGCGNSSQACSPVCGVVSSPGVRPVSVPVVLPAEGAADQPPTPILTLHPTAAWMFPEPPLQDLGGEGQRAGGPGDPRASSEMGKEGDLFPQFEQVPRSGNPWAVYLETINELLPSHPILAPLSPAKVPTRMHTD